MDPRPVADTYRYLIQIFRDNPFPTLEQARKTPRPPPEPESLARLYLRRAGLDEGDLPAAERLAGLADANGKLARQMVPR